ncbi:MAG: diguanylate cyclase, partial [Gammaproteobacteria bacterium]|nr:diguanylate cyclase [Gammaproteobacteria bacterium]
MSDLHEWRRVLVVDDSPENVRLLNEILAGDYQVLFATSGAMALEVARAQNPDLILLDVMMPEMDGYQVCNELKRDPATDRIPIIFLTGKDRDEDEELGFGLGAADYLAKPVRPAVVKMRVRNQLELKRNEDLILRQALYDPLTTLPNRQLVLERLKVMLKDSLRDNLKIALLFIDLDDFKQVNDTLGHEGGDQLLVEAARRLRESVRAVDTVGRLGGDEFTIILPRLANIESPKLIAENILQAFARPFSLVGRELIVTPSIGITVSPDDGSAPKLMLRNADTAMY